jgi:hypothetical protein
MVQSGVATQYPALFCTPHPPHFISNYLVGWGKLPLAGKILPTGACDAIAQL